MFAVKVIVFQLSSKSLHLSPVSHQIDSYPDFMKRLGVFLSSHGWDTSPSQGYLPRQYVLTPGRREARWDIYNCIAHTITNTTQCSRPGLDPRPVDPKTSAPIWVVYTYFFRTFPYLVEECLVIFWNTFTKIRWQPSWVSFAASLDKTWLVERGGSYTDHTRFFHCICLIQLCRIIMLI